MRDGSENGTSCQKTRRVATLAIAHSVTESRSCCCVAVQQYYIDEVRQSMRDRLQLNYGIDVKNSSYNAHITKTWDTMQEWVSVARQCSAVLTAVFQVTPSPTLSSNIHHRSNGDCLEGERENYQVCSVQYCVQQLYTVNCTHMNRANSSLD